MSSTQQRDLKHIWHPCSQMKDYQHFPPLVVKRARGSIIELSDGKKLIDAISSWWCKSLGHNHPSLKLAMARQMEQFEHVIFANTTNEVIVELSERLAALLPGLDKVFYAGDGSCAVEVAMKMSVHYRTLQGKPNKNKFIALKNGYHGETCGALSVSDLGIYRDAYQSLLFEPLLIEPLYVSGPSDPAWHDASDHWSQVEAKLLPQKDQTSAIIVEPIIQGAGGMKIYSADFLSRLARFAKQHDIHLIADEIMTGIGRSGKMLACQHANIIPDFVCISKGLTSGWLPFSAVLTTQTIYDAFYDDYETGKSFLHSHTYSGNVLGACVAAATLNVVEEEQLLARSEQLQQKMMSLLNDIATKTGLLVNVRGIGAMVAAELFADKFTGRGGYRVYQQAIKLGALLRPLGNTLYWLPPLTISDSHLEQLAEITQASLIMAEST